MSATLETRPAREPKWPYKLIASCEGDADGAVLDMLIAHGCPAREAVLAAMREGERTDIEGLIVERVPGGWHLLREVVDTIPASYSGLARVIDADPSKHCATQRGGFGCHSCEPGR
jgi:hypothetical protein